MKRILRILTIVCLLSAAVLAPYGAHARDPGVLVSTVDTNAVGSLAAHVLSNSDIRNGVGDSKALHLLIGGESFTVSLNKGSVVGVVRGAPPSADFTITMSRDVALAILNSVNTDKSLMRYADHRMISISSDKKGHQAAIKALYSSPALKTDAPKEGDTVKKWGHTGNIETRKDGSLKITLGPDTYSLNAFWGLTGILPPQKTPPPDLEDEIDDDSGTMSNTKKQQDDFVDKNEDLKKSKDTFADTKKKVAPKKGKESASDEEKKDLGKKGGNVDVLTVFTCGVADEERTKRALDLIDDVKKENPDAEWADSDVAIWFALLGGKNLGETTKKKVDKFFASNEEFSGDGDTGCPMSGE